MIETRRYSRGMRARRALVVAAGLLLAVGAVLVFRAFDQTSHSASDTLRPFVLTMTPVWIVATAAAAVVLRSRSR